MAECVAQWRYENDDGEEEEVVGNGNLDHESDEVDEAEAESDDEVNAFDVPVSPPPKAASKSKKSTQAPNTTASRATRKRKAR